MVRRPENPWVGVWPSSKSWRSRLLYLPFWLYVGSALLWLSALFQGRAPESSFPPSHAPTVYLLLDRSGSMERSGDLAWVKEVLVQWVKKREDLSFSLIPFARDAHFASPPVQGSSQFLEIIARTEGATSAEEDGSAAGYAVHKTAELAEESGVEQPILLLLTDGFGRAHPEDSGKQERDIPLEDAATALRKQGGALHVVVLGMAAVDGELAPHRRLLAKSATAGGGTLHLAASRERLEPLLEASVGPAKEEELPPEEWQKEWFYAGVALFAAAWILENSWLRVAR